MRLGVPVKARGVGQDSAACEHSDPAIGLLGGGENPDRPLAAGNCYALAFQLVDNVVRPRIWRRGVNGDAHFVKVSWRLGEDCRMKLN